MLWFSVGIKRVELLIHVPSLPSDLGFYWVDFWWSSCGILSAIVIFPFVDLVVFYISVGLDSFGAVCLLFFALFPVQNICSFLKLKSVDEQHQFLLCIPVISSMLRVRSC